MNPERYDYLIVGQGLAGSILSSQLLNQGKKVLVIDKLNPNSSSRVAAGLVNPITGRRIVKSWQADTLIPFAYQFYKSLEEEYLTNFFIHQDTLEVITETQQVNEWTQRMEDPSLAMYFNREPVTASDYRDKIKDFKRLIRISNSGWMDIPKFLDIYRNALMKSNSLLEESLNVSQLTITGDEIKYGNIYANRIIFCEGIQSTSNNYWKHIPFLPAKGEILTISCPDLSEKYIIVAGIFLIPIGDSKFRVGSTYEWNYSNDLPTEAGKQKLITQLETFLKIPFTIVDHRAGIRPTMKDRRPVIGIHPEYKNMYIFNGMGTKGVVLAPYFADHFINYLEGKSELLGEVDVNRFSSLYQAE